MLPMKTLKFRLVAALAALALVFSAGASAFAATPNEELLSYLRGVSILPTSYVSQAETFLNETGTQLTSDQVSQIIALVDQGVAAANNKDFAGVEAAFRQAVEIAGFTVTSFVRNGDGTFTFVVTDPVSGKWIQVTGSRTNATGYMPSEGSTTTEGGTSITGVSRTAIGNYGFVAAGVLAVLTIASGVMVYRRRLACQ
ncbi:MAG: hypothetical protein Q4C55_10255 [Eubacterium sp.]|nr:hypothetical protein [Eubacterium sp.]